jgi:hypothetical protein
VSWFQNLFDARRKIAAWQRQYNEERPHSSLSYRTSAEFAVLTAAVSAQPEKLAKPKPDGGNTSMLERDQIAEAGQRASIAGPLRCTPSPLQPGMG